jgi:DNA invertase Pin-like site-specific DNA recombinase
MTPAAHTPVIGLARVSTEEQHDSGAGLDAQETAIRAYCESRGYPLVELVREAASGKTLAKRPELQRILARLEDRDDPDRPRALVVAKLDRLARSMLDYEVMVDRAQRNGWALVVLDPSLDFSTPEGQAMGQMLMIFAKFEREMISRRTKAGMAAKRAQGVRIGRPRALEQDKRPEEAERMRVGLARIRELRGEGVSFERVAQALNAEGIPGAYGGRWHSRSVRRAVSTYGLGGS